jgi:hypothetical protein
MLEMELEQGKYHQVKRMLTTAGNQWAIGALTLESLGLAEGEWCYIESAQVVPKPALGGIAKGCRRSRRHQLARSSTNSRRCWQMIEQDRRALAVGDSPCSTTGNGG